jgi:hypothetical protein
LFDAIYSGRVEFIAVVYLAICSFREGNINMGKNELELFESEWTILQVVWEKEPCTAPDVQEA